MVLDCQVCGKVAIGEGSVEGAKVPVCERCARFASDFVMFKIPAAPSKPKAYALQSSSKGMASSQAARPSAGSAGSGGEMELAEDYGKRMMQAREKLGLTRKDLAKKLFIQEKELDGFEHQKFKPNEGLVKKLEFALGVSLREAA